MGWMSSMKNSELKPCPFCGEKPKVVEDISVSWVVCDNERCMVYARTLLNKTREEAIEAWNARADAINSRAKERTCKNLATRKDDFFCSECGYEVVGCVVDEFGCFDNPLRFSYCPNCRAKVWNDEDC